MRIFLDPGHGGHDPGATFGDLVEKEIVLKVAGGTRGMLLALGHEVLTSRFQDSFVDLKFRADMANAWLADVFISLHLNADPDPDLPGMPEAHGHESWIYPKSERGRTLAESIEEKMQLFFPGEPARGIKEANFAVLRLTKMPAVLLELAFVDTLEAGRLKDADILAGLSETICDGVDAYFKKEAGVV